MEQAFLLTVWLLNVLPRPETNLSVTYPVAAVVPLLRPFASAPVDITVLICAALVAVTVFVSARGQSPT